MTTRAMAFPTVSVEDANLDDGPRPPHAREGPPRRPAEDRPGRAIIIALVVSVHVGDLATPADGQSTASRRLVPSLGRGLGDHDHLLACLATVLRQQAAQQLTQARDAARDDADARTDAAGQRGPRFNSSVAGLLPAGRTDAVKTNMGALLSAPTAHRPTRDCRSALSAREREVLQLIVEGRTDRAIAAELSLSYRTITTHVTNLLTKLDLPSRTAAAAYAIRHGLA